ncbi:MAG TPA: 2-dehydropantoate 2-reductase, partial [Candidatus Fraserbacteria bacterium]|nr:2-dehydropantoate 2-reductase [Candidatus Fraserbacteria bacterium]
EGVRPLIGPQSWALSLQNGLGSEEIIARFVPTARLLRGSTAQGATLLEPGRIRWAGQGPTLLGLLPGVAQPPQPQAQEIIAALGRAGLPAGFTRQLEAVLWEKLLVNAAINPLTALLDLPNGRLVEEPTLRVILSDIIAEALPLARQHGVRLSPEEAVARVEQVCRATSGNISSMLQDLRGGKRTEIDFITGALLEEGRRRGRSLPLNRLLWALVAGSTRQARHHRV